MGRAKDRGQSRWFIKEKPLDDQVKACRKSLEAAERSGRNNIAEALRVKLARLTASRPAGAEPDRRLEKQAYGVQIAERAPKKGKKKQAVAQDTDTQPVRPKPLQPLGQARRKASRSTATPGQKSADFAKVQKQEATISSKTSRTNQSAGVKRAQKPCRKKIAKGLLGKRPKIDDKGAAGRSAQQKQTAVDLLLKAAAKARALRLAAGEESEEEAPLPDLPMAKIGLGEDTGQAAEDPVCPAVLSDIDFDGEGEGEGEGEEEEEEEEEEPATEDIQAIHTGEDQPRQKDGSADEKEEEDDDFFDLAEDLTMPPDAWPSSARLMNMT
ncbi:unnamed protein product [Symbiodinium sp. CCMP2592]|nr:unnamed protein product [Symbiodinium sp. CCMP2592]